MFDSLRNAKKEIVNQVDIYFRALEQDLTKKYNVQTKETDLGIDKAYEMLYLKQQSL